MKHFICIELQFRPETQRVKQTKVPVTETDGERADELVKASIKPKGEVTKYLH